MTAPTEDRISELIASLYHKGPDELRLQAEIDKAIDALAEIGTPEAISELIAYFDRTSVKPLQRRIIQAIGDQYDGLVLNFLIETTTNDNPQLREMAASRLLAWFPYERVIDPLFAVLGRLVRQGVWYEIVSTFALSGDPSLVRRLRSFLTSDQAAYRCAALIAIRLLNPPDLAAVMLVLLRHDHDGDIRFRAAQTLADARHPEIVAAFVEALNDPEYAVRSAAYYGLIRQGDPAGIEPLRARCERLAHYQKATRHELMDCLGALSTLSGGEPVEYLITLLQTPDLNIGVHAVAVERLSMLIHQPDQWTQAEPAIRDVLPLLIEMLEDDNRSRMHPALLRLMAALKASGAVKAICHQLVTHLADRITYDLIHTLGVIGDAGAVPTLIAVLGQTELDDAVLRALKRIGTSEALAAVESHSR